MRASALKKRKPGFPKVLQLFIVPAKEQHWAAMQSKERRIEFCALVLSKHSSHDYICKECHSDVVVCLSIHNLSYGLQYLPDSDSLGR